MYNLIQAYMHIYFSPSKLVFINEIISVFDRFFFPSPSQLNLFQSKKRGWIFIYSERKRGCLMKLAMVINYEQIKDGYIYLLN